VQTPVAFLIFNRPETTRRVFGEIARARPPRLLVVADGPRADVDGEAERCRAAREVIERVDWDCEVLTNYAESNMGCKRRVSSGLSWVFETVEEAIVLEDDCLPHPSFFPFCEELLERYRTDERVTMISGDNFQFNQRRTPYSYYFTRFIHIWGWASWRRAWANYDAEMKLWPELQREMNWLADILGHEDTAAYWRQIFELVYTGRLDTWDYQLAFASWAQNGLSVVPEVNLISNIGFGDAATHTGAGNVLNKLANLPAVEMPFPLRHPPHMIRNSEADQFTFREAIAPDAARRGLYQRLRGKLSTMMPKRVDR
jgi:hypothetical protein